MNIGFVAVEKEVGTLLPTGELARNDADVFVYNPVSDLFFLCLSTLPSGSSERLSCRRSSNQRHTPFVRRRTFSCVTSADRVASWYTSLQDRWSITLHSFYRPIARTTLPQHLQT